MISKKGQGLGLNAIVIAALVLIVLVILILVFKGQISAVARSFTGISEDAQDKAEESKGSLSDLFGKCEGGSHKCSVNVLMVCRDGSWKEERNCGNEDKVCEDNTCKEK